MFFKRRDPDEVAIAPADDAASSRASKTHDDAHDAAQGEPAQNVLTHASTRSIQYPVGLKLLLIMLSVFVTMFLVALDRLIIATAVPQITDDFHSVTDIGWYGSAYLLTTCACQLLFGKLYAYFDIKTVYMASVVLFEIGSAICGAAPSSPAFIAGRAVAGVGGAGCTAGTIVIMVHSVPLHRRPKYQGAFGAVFGIASVVGPLLGGAFTSSGATWRWCFYINLPLGGIVLLVLALVLKPPAREDFAGAGMGFVQKLRQLDFAGTAVFLPGTVCLLLALQWGGVEYSWNNGRIIALLVLAFVLLASFVAVQILLPKTATIPPRIMRQRSVVFAAWAAFCVGAQMMIFTYYLPIWFQAIQGVSAVDSGIRTLPLVLSMTLFAGLTGATVARVGYYTPVMLFGTCVMATGAGLLTTLKVDSGPGHWAGYQVLYGAGMGMSFQAPNLAAQTVLKTRDVSIGVSAMFFAQTLGGAVFVSVGQNVLNNELVKRVAGIPGLGGIDLKGTGATTLTKLPDDVRGPVLEAYNDALRVVFIVGLVLVCGVFVGAAGMEWKSVKKAHEEKKKAAADVEGAAVAAGVAGPAVTGAAALAAEGEKTDVEEGSEGEEKKRDVEGGSVVREKGGDLAEVDGTGVQKSEGQAVAKGN
ncbi:HC-toxin efflux carrier TOXA 15 [Colletotrichum plurivorum]|uniref:HC-toxin efflux carrier TOXA 15 n=1 Tax=Colletotrichum plurivorum TaxID=2175906 RepID=A0A8H6K7T3_9PEZI|nr:HC-toxin efflux carrier TOXA 15 [Colletotrichum plurivorum]